MNRTNILHGVTVCIKFSNITFLFQQDHFELQMMTFWGLSLSLICLFVCILTFSTIRSIQSPRTTIHLHLCISLFLAFLVFLTSISQTKNQVNAPSAKMPSRSGPNVGSNMNTSQRCWVTAELVNDLCACIRWINNNSAKFFLFPFHYFSASFVPFLLHGRLHPDLFWQ